MKRNLTLLITICFLLLMSTAVYADLPGYGARAMGMGGAYTAIADDGSGPYWNPAGVAQRFLVVTPGLGVSGSFTDAWNLLSLETFPPDLTELQDLNLKLNANAGVCFRGFALNAFADVYGATEKTGEYQMTGGAEGIGALVFTASYKVTRQFLVGVNVKKLYGQQIVYQFDPASSSSMEATGDGLGFDAGVMFKPLGNLVRVGFVARNLGANLVWSKTTTPYVFDIPTGTYTPQTSVTTEGTESLPASYTLGVSVQPPFLGFVASADAELREGKVYVRAGVEQTLLLIAFRAGAFTMDDISDDSYTLGYSGGAGLRLGPILADLAVVKAEDWQVFLTAGFKL